MQRYATWDDVLDYCVYSANPVGRLVLYLCDYRDAERQRLSDFTCTALQLANFWQDVSRDLEKGRIYIPLDALAAHGLTEEDIVARRFDARYVELMKDLIARTRELFALGCRWSSASSGTLRVDLELFSRGRTGDSRCDRSVRLQHARASSGAYEVDEVGAARRALWLPARFARFGRRSSREVSGNASAGSERAMSTALSQNQECARPADERVRGLSDGFRCRRERECPNRSRFLCGVQPDRARGRAAAFIWRFLGCRADKRNALCALYAFMRLVDDVSDEPGDLESKRRGLARWRGHAGRGARRRNERARGSCRRWRIRFRVSTFPRAIFTI